MIKNLQKNGYAISYPGFPKNTVDSSKKRCAPSFEGNKQKSRDLERILEELKSNSLVYKYTHKRTFKIIFSGKCVERKICWIGNIEELAHFIRTLTKHGYVSVKHHEVWSVTRKCFVLGDGREIANRSLTDAEKPSRAALIEQLVTRGGQTSVTP